MSDFDGVEDDVEINHETVVTWSLTDLAAQVREQLLRDVRAKGNLFGPKYAQKKTPLASQPQAPGTWRIF